MRLARAFPPRSRSAASLTFAFFGTDAYVAFTVTHARHSSIAARRHRADRGDAHVDDRLVDSGTDVCTASDRDGSCASACFTIVCGIALMIAVAQGDVPTVFAVVAWGIAGLGMGMSYSTISLVVLADAPAGAEGTATASMQLSDTLGTALGTGFTGAIVAAGASLAWTSGTALTVAFAVCAAIAVLAALGTRQLPRFLAEKNA